LFRRDVGKEMATFSQFAVYASDLALSHANLNPSTMSPAEKERMGVTVSSGGIGSLEEIKVGADAFYGQSIKKLSPYFAPKILINMAGGQVSIRHGLKGPLHTVATACAAGSHAVGDAFNFIRLGFADRMLAGGTESSMDPLSIAAFVRLRALTTQTMSRPFDRDRTGFVMGEGSCLLVLEELEAAQRRGANIIAEVLGYGASSDAHHTTSPAPDGGGAKRSMQAALWDAAASLDTKVGELKMQVGYVNAHATSTPQGDAIESRAIAAFFSSSSSSPSIEGAGGGLLVSSTKGATGHLLGAAGALEIAFTALALRDGIVPPTANLDNIGLECDGRGVFTHVPKKAVQAPSLRLALKNSFGFGGTNASILLGKYVP
jgi:3-oxoacyl-[acyl-carrier-protein] synthase II